MLKFNSDGLLPPKDYTLTLRALQESILVMGIQSCTPTWDSAWRKQLVINLRVLANQLWSIGIVEIFINGSFVEEKDHPNDIDGYFVCDLDHLASGNLHRELNALDPHKVWTWDPKSRTPAPGSQKLQLPMWHQYRVELYPHYGQGSGIVDSRGYELEFPSAFRQTRGEGKPKGIIKLMKEAHD